VRIEDVDTPRCVPGADQLILQQLAACGLLPDEAPQWQSHRGQLYQAALAQLTVAGLAYPCACSRKDIALAQSASGHTATRGEETPYPSTCRPENGGLRGRPARAWRLYVLRSMKNRAPAQSGKAQEATFFEANPSTAIHWTDRRLGPQSQDVAQTVGDFVLRRADGLWAYQLAVVVDDAAQGITHVVRGEDLADNTPRQILLQWALGLPTPHYLHTPLVLAADGEKLSKQNGAAPLDTSAPLALLQTAASRLNLPPSTATTVTDALAFWVAAWHAQWTACTRSQA
jgi:glutamyl-Q tRNA(Asp) synthetase